MPFLARFFHITFFLISSWINHAQDIPSSQLIISQRISKGSLEQNTHFFLILPFNVPYLRFWSCYALTLGKRVTEFSFFWRILYVTLCIYIISSYIIDSAYSLCIGEHWHASCERQCTCSSRLWKNTKSNILGKLWIYTHLYKYKPTRNTNMKTCSHKIQIPSHNDAVFVASDTLPFVADCVSEILKWSASTL